MRWTIVVGLLLVVGCSRETRIIGTSHSPASQSTERVVYLENSVIKEKLVQKDERAFYWLVMSTGKFMPCTKEQHDEAWLKFHPGQPLADAYNSNL